MLTLEAGSRHIAPTLATACAALPPEGAFAPWVGPAVLGASKTPRARGCTSLSMTLQENTTSAEVNGLPSCHLAFRRRWNV